MEFAENWEKTKARFDAFWQSEVLDRCMIAAFAPRDGAKQGDFPFPDTWNEQASWWLDGERVFKRQYHGMQNTYYGGDAFPQFGLDCGAAGHAGFFRGARATFQQGTIWYHPSIEDIERDELIFDRSNSFYSQIIELAKYLCAESKGRAFVSNADTCGNLDALAHLRGNEAVLMDLLTDPDWVDASLATIQQAWETFHEELITILQAHNDGGASVGWLNTWGRGRHGQMQADISVMMSEAMFDRFILPELVPQTRWFDHSLYHLDGLEQLRFLDTLLALPDLDAIQWTCVEGQPPPVAFLPELRRMQQAGKKLVFRVYNLRDLEDMLTGLSSKGLMMGIHCETEDEARQAVRMAERLTHD